MTTRRTDERLIFFSALRAFQAFGRFDLAWRSLPILESWFFLYFLATRPAFIVLSVKWLNLDYLGFFVFNRRSMVIGPPDDWQDLALNKST